MIKNNLYIFILVVFFSACEEYTSFYPIAKPSESTVKSPFTGDWKFVSGVKLIDGVDIGYGPHFMRVSPFNSNEYLLQLVSDSLKSIGDINCFRGYTTILKGKHFANISPVNNEGKRPVYSIYKYDLKNDSLIFYGISEKTFESLNTYVNSIGQHRKFIRSSIDNSDWWDVVYKYVKVTQ